MRVMISICANASLVLPSFNAMLHESCLVHALIYVCALICKDRKRPGRLEH
jgi:hypothetical protein